MVSPKKGGTRFYICNNLFLSSTPLSRFESLSFYFVKIMDGTIVIFHISTSDNMKYIMYVHICMFEKNEYICFGFCLFDRTIYEMREKYQHLNLLNNLDSSSPFKRCLSNGNMIHSNEIFSSLFIFFKNLSWKINNSYNIVCISRTNSSGGFVYSKSSSGFQTPEIDVKQSWMSLMPPPTRRHVYKCFLSILLGHKSKRAQLPPRINKIYVYFSFSYFQHKQHQQTFVE